MAAASALEELQRTWEGVLYTQPGHKINGHAIGPFGWVGITVSPGDHGELLRATYKQTKLKSLKRPPSGSEEEAAAVLTLASLLVEAYEKHAGADADAGLRVERGAGRRRLGQGLLRHLLLWLGKAGLGGAPAHVRRAHARSVLWGGRGRREARPAGRAWGCSACWKTGLGRGAPR